MSDAVASLQSDAEGNPRDRLFDITPEPQKHEATLNGVSDTFHSVNVRGRRTVPPTGFSPRSMAAHVAATNNLAVLFMAKVWQSRLSALPRISLSVRYYVIALRHILR